MTALDYAGRAWRRSPTTQVAHVERETMPSKLGAALMFMAGGGRASYCGQLITSWPELDVEHEPEEPVCARCLRGWYADEETDG